MAIAPGTIVGPYEILTLLGAGGMGEVYLARDTHLNRQVALKTLPTSVATDHDRLARFKREAQVLASLNHPNIGAIHGFEESSGVRALVLELIEGPTLEDRLARGPIPPDEVWPIARQLCDALEAAHERSIIHRDLKPANIKLRPDGTVKVLDFGLAKALDPMLSGTTPDVTMSPTITSPAMTRAGVILGTAAYMSPEQARGATLDARTDVWAFGCVLYEMLSGRRAFPGETVSDAIAAILEREPVWDALPAATPESIRRLLRRCLAKDPKRRLRHIGDARIDIEEASAPPASGLDTPKGASGSTQTSRWPAIVAVASIGALLAGGLIWAFRGPRAALFQRRSVARLFVEPDEPLASSAEGLVAISPDGQRLVYVAGRDRERHLYLRDIDQFEGKPILGTDGADYPQFSPDGRWLAFVADRKVKKIEVTGGTPLILCDVARANSLSWGANGESILYNQGPASGIWSVPANGGKPVEITKLAVNEIDHRHPEMLPDGTALLFSDFAGSGGQQIYAQSLKTGERHRIGTGSAARYLATGHIVYVNEGTLYAMRFDAVRLEASGEPIPLVTDVLELTSGPTPQVSVSASGTLVYLAGGHQRQDSLVWVDHDGRESTAAPVGGPYALPRLSPNGKRLAVRFGDSSRNTGDVYLYDFAREAWNRLTTSDNITMMLWGRDETHLTLGDAADGHWSIYTKSLDGSTRDEQLLSGTSTTYPLSWSPDSDQLAIVTIKASSGTDIEMVDRRKPGQSRPFLASKDREGAPEFSPNGHWIAYVSDKSGSTEVYLRPYPGPGEEVTVSIGGGNEPRWATNAPLLFFRRDDVMMAVDVVTSPALSVGKPRRIFERPYARSNAFWPDYDVTPDGQRLLMVKRVDDSTPTKINVVLNWFDELKARVPVAR